MRVLHPLVAALTVALSGCPAFKSSTPDRPEIVEEIQVRGFDPAGEPVIKRWSNGTVWIQFEAMPPFFAEEAGREAEFESFDRRLSEALGGGGAVGGPRAVRDREAGRRYGESGKGVAGELPRPVRTRMPTGLLLALQDADLTR